MLRQVILMSPFLRHSSAMDIRMRIVPSLKPAAFIIPSDNFRNSVISFITRVGRAVRRAFFAVFESESVSS